MAHQWLSALLVHLADHTESKAKIAGKDSRRMFPMRRPPPATPPKVRRDHTGSH